MLLPDTMFWLAYLADDEIRLIIIIFAINNVDCQHSNIYTCGKPFASIDVISITFPLFPRSIMYTNILA